jgi:hypothetical protein
VKIPRVDWDAHVQREVQRYRDGEGRLGGDADSGTRQRQLTRIGNAAYGAGLALLMQGDAEAGAWFARAAERYRESFVDAPPDSWGRPIAMIKSRVLAGDWEAAGREAEFALEQGAAVAASPIGRYAACLALLVLGRDEEAQPLADALRTEEGFPHDVGDALAMLTARDRVGYVDAVESVLESFETRESHLEDIPVAETVIVLQALASRRDLAADLASPLLP